MTDDRHPSDQRRLRASAYLDDELAPDERARAEADPDVMAEVEAMRRVRSLVTDVPAPDAARREVAIATALAAMPSSGVRAPARPSTSERRRSRWLAPLAAAAAAAVLVVGGVVALRGGSADDDGGSEAALTDRAATGTTPVGQAAAGGEAETTAGDAATPAPGAAATTAAGAETSRAVADVADGTQLEAAETTEGASEVTTDQVVVLRSAADLRAVAAGSFAASPDAEVPPGDSRPSGAAACGLGRFVGMGQFAPDDRPPVDVEVYVDDETGEVVAADAQTCTVVLTAPP